MSEPSNKTCLRRWDDLNPEILAQILVCLPADQRVRYCAPVCKSWLACLSGPYCWNDIDIEEWCRRALRKVDTIDFVTRRLVRRSRGNFRRFCAYRLGRNGFVFVANRVLEIPMCGIDDKLVEIHAKSLGNLTELNISYCLSITSKGLETFGKNCKFLTRLKRNMPPQEYGQPLAIDDPEAIAIADTMPNLKHLELCYGRFGDTGLSAIMNKCKDLCFLDIQGTWNVNLNGDLEDKCSKVAAFTAPWDALEDDLISENDDSSDDETSEDDSE